MSEEEEINEEQHLYTRYDISTYRVVPDYLDWEIGLDNKYTYKELKRQAIEDFTVTGPVNTRQEKIIAKLTVTTHIMNKFDELLKRLDEELERYINEDLNVRDFLQKNEALGQSFIRSLQSEVQRYKTKINNLHKAWFNDWKDIGLVEEYQPKLKAFTMMDKTEGARLQREVRNILKEILKDTPGDTKNNPVKYWITTYAFSRLSEIKSLRKEVDNVAYNADTFTQEIVENKLKQYVLDIEKLTNNSISDAYYKVDEIMNYVENFCDISHEINYSKNIRFYDRVNKLKIQEGYRIGDGTVKTELVNIYLELKSKVSGMTDFIKFVKKANPRYFKYFNDEDVAAVLFEIYFIRASSERNRNNWNIKNLINLYEAYKLNKDIRIQLDIEEAFTIKKMFSAMGSAIGRGFGHIIPESVKWFYRN